MTKREKIISLAIRCNILNEIELLECNPWRQDTIRELTEFYHLVRNEVLEEAATICDGTCNVNNCLNDEEAYYGREMAKAIRSMKDDWYGADNPNTTDWRKPLLTKVEVL